MQKQVDPVRDGLDAACNWMQENMGNAENLQAWKGDAADIVAEFMHAFAVGCRRRGEMMFAENAEALAEAVRKAGVQ